jgi:hypothetical protein
MCDESSLPSAGPSDDELLHRAYSFANEATIAVDLQRSRIRPPSNPTTQWIDLHFLVVALWRLRRAANLASQVPRVRDQIRGTLALFDSALPDLRDMRDAAEHIDDRALSKPPRRGRQAVSRFDLQSGSWSSAEETWTWAGRSLDVRAAHSAAMKLLSAMREADPHCRLSYEEPG